MIELKKNSEKFYFDVIIDGESYNRVYANGVMDFDFHSENKEASQILINYKLNEFPSFKEIWLEDVFNWLEYEHTLWIKFDYSQKVKTKNLIISFVFEPKLLFWSKNYSFKEYSNVFGSIWKIKKRYGDFKYYEEEQPLFSIEIVVPKFESTINNFVSPYLNTLKLVHQEVLETLSLNTDQKSLKTLFEFPEAVKSYCEQYLLYFAQFLRDLGVNATSNLKEEAGKVLFSITPTDDIEALDKIHEALEVYLRLPSSPLVSNSQEIAIQRLESQVEYFRSQIRLARAENQLNQATIQQQQVTIIKLGENVMIDSMIKNVTESKKDNKGEILGGAIQLATPKKLEDYGIKKIDLDKLWKYLKEKFGK